MKRNNITFSGSIYKTVSFLCVVLMCIGMMLFAGCGAVKSEDTKKIYCITTDKLGLVTVDYEYESEAPGDIVYEAIGQLTKETGSAKYMRAIPVGVEITDYTIADGLLAIYFTREYSNMDSLTEMLVRAAVVKTMVQLPEIDSVVFYVNGKPLEKVNGELVGAMTSDMFIDDFSQETDSLVKSSVVLYYATADGAYLVPQKKSVYRSSNVTLERFVVDQLLKGPSDTTLLNTIPSEAKILGVTVTDGICYVNFDQGLLKSIAGVTENVTIYSIVNSLVELDTVTGVVITVDGKTPKFANIDYSLSEILTKNDDILDANRPKDSDRVDIVEDLIPVVQ